MTTTDRPAGPRSDLTLLALHGLRLQGFAPAPVIAERFGIDRDHLERCLELLAARGLVARRRGDDGRWTLTAAGRAEGERLLAAELDAAGQRETVTDAYRQFRCLNPELLAACSAWQVKDTAAGLLNDHTDPAYDQAVIDQLGSIDAAAQPIVARLGR
ncbi:MAG: Rrf2 family transcriptional regulator, partial [Acidimicrobiia bacterium]|nr:Rrf2 family transcriptional regulator [Acidimicrobiia bacterium]